MNLTNKLPDKFRFEHGNWVRIEPRARSDQYHRGLEARTADPLWFLSRQWQMGELQAEDAGSPICARLTYSMQTIKSVRPGKSKQAIPIEGNPPLEMLVEHEPNAMNWRTRIQMGQHFERLIWAQVPPNAKNAITNSINELLTKYRTQTFAINVAEQAYEDRATQQFKEFMKDRVMDGGAVWERIQKPGTLPDVPSNLRTMINDAVGEFKDWVTAIHPEANSNLSAWQPESLDHRFAVEASDGANGSMTLEAPDYRNGELDWYSFAVKKGRWSKPHEPRTKVFTPTQITFGGMPHSRWWEFEDHAVDFGDIEGDKTDLAHLMLMQFGLVYSDDWYVVPLTLPLGSITRIEKLEVTDVFGQKTIIPQGITSHKDPLKRFHLYGVEFEKSVKGQAARFLFLPPAVPFREESPPLEEVRFIRDENANMVWGVEHLVQNARGDAVDGFEAQQERRKQSLSEKRTPKEDTGDQNGNNPNENTPEYKLASLVSDNWIPFIPVQIKPGEPSTRLQRAIMIRNEEKNIPEEIKSMTHILNHQNPRDLSSKPIATLHEEAVLRAGLKIQITKQRVRWIDGKTYVWQGRKIVTGRGEGNSGLKFDFLKKK